MDYTGKRVRLAADAEEGFPEEIGTVLEDYGDGMLFVEIDQEYRVDEFDDGFRECSSDQVAEVLDK